CPPTKLGEGAPRSGVGGTLTCPLPPRLRWRSAGQGPSPFAAAQGDKGLRLVRRRRCGFRPPTSDFRHSPPTTCHLPPTTYHLPPTTAPYRPREKTSGLGWRSARWAMRLERAKRAVTDP